MTIRAHHTTHCLEPGPDPSVHTTQGRNIVTYEVQFHRTVHQDNTKVNVYKSSGTTEHCQSGALCGYHTAASFISACACDRP